MIDVYPIPELFVRTDIDDALMDAAQQASGLTLREATVEAGLRLLMHLRAQQDMLHLAGKVAWKGNLEESRLGRNAT